MAVIRDIARQIVAKHQLKQAEADHFVQMMVEVIHEGLLADRQVKIKGFGTFKLQTVKERSSVNISTGERVTISEHDKVTFTPDNVMRDIINKPFAQFETVVVEAGSPLLAEEGLAQEAEEPVEQPAQAEEVPEEKPVEVELPAPVETKEGPQEAATEQEEEPEDVETDAETETGQEEDEECTEGCDRQRSDCRSIFIYYGVLINVIVALVAFAAGYFVATKTTADKGGDTVAVAVQNAPKTAKKAVKRVKPTAKKDTATVVVPEVKKQEEQPLKGYDSDPRVRTGAYYIMGTAQEVTVQQGQTLASISRAYLGPDMECYIEAYNGTASVKAGDKLKIPRLKLKKSMKKR